MKLISAKASGPLETLQNATRMLAKVSTAAEAKRMMDMADAAKFYAKKAGLGEEAELYAHQIKIDAQTMLGAFLKNAPKAKGGEPMKRKHSTSSNGEPVENGNEFDPLTLKSAGISKKLSSESQALHTAKENAPEIHQKVREKKLHVRKVKKEMEGRRGLTEAEKEARALVEVKRHTTRWLEKECAVLNSGCSSKLTASKIDLSLSIYADDPERKLTPERLRSAGKRLIEIADEWESL